MASPDKSPSSSSLLTPPSLSSFKFNMIGKEPDLLKRISAPQPNQDYQDDATSTSHSPVIDRNEIPLSRPSLLQKLAPGNNFEIDSSDPHGDTPVTPSRSPHDSLAPKPISPFNPLCRTLFRSGPKKANSPSVSIPKRPSSPSDMELSPPSERDMCTLPASNSQASMKDVVGARSSSTDSVISLELAYPPTNSAMSISPEPPNPLEPTPTEIALPPFRELPTRVISYLESRTTQQSKLLDSITSLERDLQAASNESSLSVEIAERAGAAAEKSLTEAKDAMELAQQSYSAAKTAKSRADHALSQLVHLRRHCEDERLKDVQDRAELICSATSVNRDIATFSQSLTEGLRRRSDTDSSGLGHEELYHLLGETARLARNRQLSSGLRKRKLDVVQSDSPSASDVPPRPSKAARREQRQLSIDNMVEMEAEAAREAWFQEVERRSAVPPDPSLRTAHDQHTNEGAPMEDADVSIREHQQGLDAGHNEPSQLPSDQDLAQRMAQPTLAAPIRLEIPMERTESSRSRPDITLEEGMEKKKESKARWERELAEQKQGGRMQERDVRTKGNDRKESNVTVSTELRQEGERRCALKPPPVFVPASVTSMVDAAVHDGQRVRQPKPGACDASRKKEIQLRLALEKQRAPPSATANAHFHDPESQDKANNDARVQEQPQQQPEQTRDEGRQHAQDKRGEHGASTTVGNACVSGLSTKGNLKQRANGISEPGTLGISKGGPTSGVGNVTAQKTLVASAQKRVKTSRSSQSNAGLANEQLTLQANTPTLSISSPDMQPPTFPPLFLPPMASSFQGQPISFFPQPFTAMWHPGFPQEGRFNSVPPIECLVEAGQPTSANSKKTAATSRVRQKSKQNTRKVLPARSVQGVTPSNQAGPQPFNGAAVSTENANVGTPKALPDVIVPKVEVMSPTLTPLPVDQRDGQRPQNTGAQLLEPAPASVRPAFPTEVTSNPTSKAGRVAVGSDVHSISHPSPDSRPVGSPSTIPPPNAIDSQPPADNQLESSTSAANPKPTSTTSTAEQGGLRKSSGNGNGSKSTLMIDPEPRVRPSAARVYTTGDPPTAANAPINPEWVPSSHAKPVVHDDKGKRLSEADSSASAHIHPKQPRQWVPPSPRGRKRPLNEIDMDGRHWSPGQETCRIRLRSVSGSPPRPTSRSPTSSRPLSQRLGPHGTDGIRGQSYRPGYDTYRPLDGPTNAYGRDDGGYHSRPLLDRFSEPIKRSYAGRQAFKRPKPTSPDLARSVTRPLEQRIS